jgi:hypothetical protein
MINYFLHTLKNIIYIFRYIRDLFFFYKQNTKKENITIYPILYDFNSFAGVAKGHYFHQDLLVAQYIFQNNPKSHVDFGSRIDGFVAHVASFRKINLYDIRDVIVSAHVNINFIKRDIFDTEPITELYDSLSCLHALEHFGLGRYGDRVDNSAHLKALDIFIEMVKPQGRLYLSVPIANKASVAFHAHRIFHINDIPNLTKHKLKLIRFDYVDDHGDLHPDSDVNKAVDLTYGCGIYSFIKI